LGTKWESPGRGRRGGGWESDCVCVNAVEIVDEIAANAAALDFETTTLAKCFAREKFFGDNRNFPHAHYGYLMACMGQLDLVSQSEYGPGNPLASCPSID